MSEALLVEYSTNGIHFFNMLYHLIKVIDQFNIFQLDFFWVFFFRFYQSL